MMHSRKPAQLPATPEAPVQEFIPVEDAPEVAKLSEARDKLKAETAARKEAQKRVDELTTALAAQEREIVELKAKLYDCLCK